MAVSGTVTITANFSQTKTAGLSTASAPIVYSKSYTITDGTGANACKAVWSDSRTLTATSESLDLSGVLTDAFGVAIVGTAVKLMLIENTHATADLTVGGVASLGFSTPFGDPTDKIKVGPGQVLLLTSLAAAGFVVAAGTGDLLKIDAGAATITYKVIIAFNT